MLKKIERGCCFGCGTWVWQMDPEGILIPLAHCREGYLFCENNELAKVTTCVRCEEDLINGDEKKMLQVLGVFVTSFGGKQLSNPVRYENSKAHWRSKGIDIPVPWESALARDQMEADYLEQQWAQFKRAKYEDKDVSVFSQYMLGAHAFYQWLCRRIGGGDD